MSIVLSASITPLHATEGHSPQEPAALRRFAARMDGAGLDFLILRGPADALITASWLITFTRRIGLVCSIPATYAQPFHTARALAAMDALSGGRMGWLPTIGEHDELSAAYGPGLSLSRDRAADKAAEYIAATQALWDSWDADALIIDKESAVYLDSAKIRRVDFQGEYFRVMGPLNAARPPQGYPVLVRDDAESEFREPSQTPELVIIGAAMPSDPQNRIATLRANGAGCILVTVMCSSTVTASAATSPGLTAVGDAEQIAERLTAWHRTLGCDGFHIVANDTSERQITLLESLLGVLRDRGAPPNAREAGVCVSGTLRSRLGLPTPSNRYSSP